MARAVLAWDSNCIPAGRHSTNDGHAADSKARQCACSDATRSQLLPLTLCCCRRRCCCTRLLLLLPACSTKGAAKSLGNTWSSGKAAWVSALIAAGTSFLTAIVIVPILRWMARKRIEAVDTKTAAESDKRWGCSLQCMSQHTHCAGSNCHNSTSRCCLDLLIDTFKVASAAANPDTLCAPSCVCAEGGRRGDSREPLR